ncbi:hypothetical protein PGB90_002156 [Kerria lacca]
MKLKLLPKIGKGNGPGTCASILRKRGSKLHLSMINLNKRVKLIMNKILLTSIMEIM